MPAMYDHKVQIVRLEGVFTLFVIATLSSQEFMMLFNSKSLSCACNSYPFCQMMYGDYKLRKEEERG